MEQIKERLSRLRLYMKTYSIDLCIVPTADYHQSEYVAEHFKYRAYLSGFSGSAGTLVVTATQAKLWTDSRYFLQAAQQLEGSGIDLMKIRCEGYPTMLEWIAAQDIRRIGIDAEVFSVREVQDLQAAIDGRGILLDTAFKSYDAVWNGRPALPDAPAYLLGTEVSGESTLSKLERVRQAMQQAGADYYLLASLDEIAWCLNLRGEDIAYNPCALAYAIIGSEDCHLYMQEDKLSDEDVATLEQFKVYLRPYGQFAQDIRALSPEAKVCFDADKINYLVYESIPQACLHLPVNSIINRMKAVKNATELAGIDRAMVKDGICFVRFWKKMEDLLDSGVQPGEYDLAELLAQERLQQPACVGESFDAIVAYGENAAIVHYTPTAQAQTKVHYGNILLIDHGGQYNTDGTTDMTRTIALYRHPEELPEDYLQDYAAVLKGNIALAQAVFPQGTRGCQLDVLARQFMWKLGCNYGHGTGHGIGHFLNVHEGPQSIRMEENPVALEESMIISNEPGIYKTGKYGIRLETMIAVEKAFESDFGRFLRFRTLTVCPWDLMSIKTEYYTREELDYINDYHAMVYRTLSPYLNDEECRWLQTKTRSIS